MRDPPGVPLGDYRGRVGVRFTCLGCTPPLTYRLTLLFCRTLCVDQQTFQRIAGAIRCG